MDNFSFHNPVRIVFGKGSIAQLAQLVPAGARVMLLYGGGSIRGNGVYQQVQAALAGRIASEFAGIEPNPRYETCLRAVAQAREARVDFLLAAGGGSVLDGVKFIAAALRYSGTDPWQILRGHGAGVVEAVPLGAVLTLPATGSEMNANSVISRESTGEKLHFAADAVYPRFSILDPETTYSLPPRQVANGIVDTFVHTTEQYLTHPAANPLQDRQAEAILATLIEEAPKVRTNPRDYAVRANLMWCATQALNGVIGLGVPQDWATHMIGHELTALYGIDHGQSLAVVLPGVLRHDLPRRQAKLRQYLTRVWQRAGEVGLAIDLTESFFQQVGVPTRLADYQIDTADAAARVSQRLAARGGPGLGPHGDIDPTQVAAILRSR
jgi:NADP-dependent alcohol dehydrogenase